MAASLHGFFKKTSKIFQMVKKPPARFGALAAGASGRTSLQPIGQLTPVPRRPQ
ncbi:hypothetical protein SS05631_c39740 [Sinorhizobium sp. CCBAU 05631]|nr:hypothetical protein SS05631_c39740 [Sinorhizobium sp. CCBAU 05631]